LVLGSKFSLLVAIYLCEKYGLSEVTKLVEMSSEAVELWQEGLALLTPRRIDEKDSGGIDLRLDHLFEVVDVVSAKSQDVVIIVD